MTPRQDPVLDWLLEKEDPGVRALTLRDVLGAPADDADVLAARRATVRASPVKDILAAMSPEGWWEKPGPGYSPKYTGTVWSMAFLGQFAADGDDRRVRRAADYVLDHSRAPSGGFSASATAGGLVHCLQGNLASSFLELGYGDDPRLKAALDWLARSITGDGIAPNTDPRAEVRYLKSANSAPGFVCSANNQKPCAWGAVPALDALRRIPPRRRSQAVRRALAAGEAFLLSRDPAAADYPMGWAARPSGSWFKFGYPMGYICDVLRTAEVLVGLGHGRDPRLLNLRRLTGKVCFDLGATSQPSTWVTLRALRALRGMGDGAQGE